MVWGAVLERQALFAIAENLKNTNPFLSWVPSPLFVLLLTPFHWRSLRFFFLPAIAFILALILGARYLQDIYNLPNLKLSFNYVVACLFGFGYPTLRIGLPEESAISKDASYLPEIGGPGYLDIQAAFAVMVSRPQAASNIYAEGQHFLTRGEKVEEVADLNDQQDTIEKMSAFSHEGVAIQITDIHFGYRLKHSPPIEISLASTKELKPYSFSLQALRNLMQSRVVTEQGLTDWRTMVKGMIRSTISDFIYQHTVVELLKPPADYNPYADLKKIFQSKAIRERLRKMGSELLWINVGLFDLDKEEYKQELLKTWQPQGHHLPTSLSSEINSEEAVGRAKAEFISELLNVLEQDPSQLDTTERIRSFLTSVTSRSNRTSAGSSN